MTSPRRGKSTLQTRLVIKSLEPRGKEVQVICGEIRAHIAVRRGNGCGRSGKNENELGDYRHNTKEKNKVPVGRPRVQNRVMNLRLYAQPIDPHRHSVIIARKGRGAGSSANQNKEGIESGRGNDCVLKQDAK